MNNRLWSVNFTEQQKELSLLQSKLIGFSHFKSILKQSFKLITNTTELKLKLSLSSVKGLQY